MNQQQHIRYREWEIVPFSIPGPDGKWFANCEIEKTDAQGMESFQGVLGVFVRDQKDNAIMAACEDAKRQIDAIIADPLV